MYDIIIIGAGPAGITASIYSARKKMKTLVITKNIGGQASLSGNIENYTGYQFITGPELATKFEEHMKNFDIILKKEEVISVVKSNNVFFVKSKNHLYKSLSVIISTGRIPKKLNIPGERKFKNRGVTYCATCDAPLFSDKKVAIIGGGNSALDAALQLINIAKCVYIINISKELTGDHLMREKVLKSRKIKVLNNSEIKEIFGEDFVKGIKVCTNKTEKIIEVEGVFIEIGSLPALIDVKPKLKLNKYNEIVVNEKCETNIPGLFAAGDVTNVPEKQIIVAAGHGCIAALSAFKYIQKRFKPY